MIPLYKPYMPELPELNKILYSGKLSMGEYTAQFEASLKAYLRAEHLLSVNSFDNAIAVSTTALGLQSGDEIIASPMACLASMQPYVSKGLRVVWADIDPYTGTLNPEDVAKRVSNKTRAIVHNHFCGYPGYIDEINQIGHENGVFVIDDGIECFGATYKGKKIGDCGTDVTVFSFNPVRPITTIDGGAIIFRNKELYQKSILIRDCGIDRTIFRDSLGEISPLCDISLRGYSATLNNLHAYIGTQQLLSLDDRLAKQKRNAKVWEETLSGYGKFRPVKSPDGEPNYWVYGILAPNKTICIQQFRDLGFYASGVHFNNLRYSVFGKQTEVLPGVEQFFNSFVALPCGWWMGEE